MRPIRFVENRDLERYLETDRIGVLLDEVEQAGDSAFTSHRWLRDSAPKRMIFGEMYGDLLFGGSSRRLRILDVGGGVTALSRLLVRRHDYHLIDIFAHETAALLEPFQREAGGVFWTEGDWYSLAPGDRYDVIIANDLFPNVDQRLSEFLKYALPHCAELRISLTFYNQPRHYLVRRIDNANEVLCVKAYDGEQTAAAVAKFKDRLPLPDLGGFLREDRPSLYANGRQVAIAVFPGFA